MSSVLLECKKICLKRCLTAVALSIAMQFLLVAVFLLFINFHILHPVDWLTETFRLMFSFITWVSIMPLLAAVIVYGIILGKSHLAVKHYYATRFRWLLGTGARKTIFFNVHLLVGFLTAWLYTRFLSVDYRNFIFQCANAQCINSRYTFLIFAGITAGCYHFVKENLRQEPQVEYPIIQEAKFVKIRSILYATLYNSLIKSFTPTLCFAFAYWLLGSIINGRCARLLDVDEDEKLASFLGIAGNWHLLFYAWILSSQILSNMYLMQHFFSILLAEELHFVIAKNPVLIECNNEVTLVEALSMNQVPVVQNLAALDLYNISMDKVATRRQEIFALSVPGSHPYNWNQLSSQCLSLISAYTDELCASVKNISTMKTSPLCANVKVSATDAAEKILLRQYNATYGIRRLMADPSVATQTDTCVKQPKGINSACKRINEQFERLITQIEQSLRTAFRTIPGLYYMFGEPDGAKTAFMLSNAQTIVWLTQGLAGICAASLYEDKYGVVQETLAQIIKALLRLKLELDKLNNVNLNGKKMDRNLLTLKSAVKRSLYKICTVFGDYLRDVIDEHDDWRNLQMFLSYHEA